MARPYAKLRGALKEQELDLRHLARLLKISVNTLSRKLNARSKWTLDEAYETLRLLGRPASDLPVYFPPGGQNEEERYRGKKPAKVRRFAVRRVVRL